MRGLEKGGGTESEDNRNAPIPSISLPKGGGAIQGIGEKFAANPVTGTGTMTVPIATSPARSGFGPQLSLSYDSIERWTNLATGEIHWRSISRDNVTTLYGKNDNSRIRDPADPTRIYSWLICESYDDKGNAIVYEYAAENDAGIDHSLSNERNRLRTANRYLKRIKYGNLAGCGSRRTPCRHLDVRGGVRLRRGSLRRDCA